MNLVAKFIIDDQYYIEVLVPPFGEKENSFCDPTPLLHNCDFIKVYLVTPLSEKFVVYDDILEVFITHMQDRLTRVLNEKLELPPDVTLGTIGYSYNMKNYYLTNNSIKYSLYRLWSTNKPNGGNQSWLYSKNNIIYLEIAPNYEWLRMEPPIADDKELFQQFMDNYKPLLFTELSIATINAWIEQCKYLYETIDRPSKRKS